MPTKRGAFIVIEGLDRSGKSTQAELLLCRLQETHPNRPVKLMKFPDRTTPIGQMIDAYLRSRTELDDRAIHLLFAANRWELASHIESLLAAGTLVLCDRYAFSGIAFSASKRTAESGDRPALTYEWCRAPERLLPAPDLTIFLDIDAQSARARCGYGEERYERADLQARVREVFRRIGNEMGASRWVTIDAAPSQERVQELVWAEVQKVAEEGIVGPIHRLWDDVQLPTSV